MMRLLVALVAALGVLAPAGQSHAAGVPNVTPADPTLYLVLQGPDRWSVDRAANGWGGRVKVVSACPATGKCLRVVQRRFGKTVWFGRYDPTNEEIDLNNTIKSTALQRLVAACHEIGHALGVGHAPNGTATCMQTWAGGYTTPGLWGLSHIGRLPLYQI